MPRIKVVLAMLAACTALAVLPAAPAPAGEVPSWAESAVDYLVRHDYIERSDFRANKPMSRTAFKRLMSKAFGGGYNRTGGDVKAREVDAALGKVVGGKAVARRIARTTSPDGWDPEVSRWDAYGIVARELGLRHDRGTTEERFESSPKEAMPQADIAYGVWKAKTGASTWALDELDSFELASYSDKLRKVVKFAFAQVGNPYVWSGEWNSVTPAGYPYGAQDHGGFDCSGFSWFVLRQASSGWDPPGRPYEGWRLGERSSSDMAAATKDKLRYGDLKPGDLLLFGPDGRRSSASSIFHAGIYLGRDWVIDSSGSQAGVSLSYIGPDSWWNEQFAWGRRIIKR